MWKVEAEGSTDTIYRNLKEAFHEAHVEEVYDDTVIPNLRSGKVQRLAMRTKTENGVSEQFRTVQKSLQTMLPVFKGKIKVTCSGTPGQAIEMKVERV